VKPQWRNCFGKINLEQDKKMNTLSGLDATFLYLELPEMPMHVGSFSLYELSQDLKGLLPTDYPLLLAPW
jgi:hypothetical protein